MAAFAPVTREAGIAGCRTAAVRRRGWISISPKRSFPAPPAAGSSFCGTGLPQFAFAGRSNVGKSSVINRLLNRKNFARVGAAPGKTTHINYFLIDGAFYLVDLPGYATPRCPRRRKPAGVA